MQINKIDRKNETIQIIKNDKEIVELTFREIDMLINFLFNFKYLVIENAIRFNHFPPEIRLATEKHTAKII